MGDRSGIEWTDATWNPVTGCSKVSPGCANCYAEALSLRQGWSKLPWTPENVKANIVLHPDRLDQPLRWKKPRMVFVNSMSDLFHEEIPLEFLAQVWDVMVRAPQHTFQILTKRPERIARALGPDGIGFYGVEGSVPFPQPNIWLGTSIENARFTWRADALRGSPAKVRFISAEPLLGSLFATRMMVRRDELGGGWNAPAPLDLAGIDWVIVGGESGPGARPMDPVWAREVRDAVLGERSGLFRPAFFFKQWGGRSAKAGGKLLDGRAWCEMPS